MILIRVFFWLIITLTCIFPVGSFLLSSASQLDLNFVGIILNDPYIKLSLGFSLLVGATTTLLCCILGVVLALFLLSVNQRVSLILSLFLIAASLTPPFVGPLGFQFLFRLVGLQSSFLGIIISQVIYLCPITALIIETSARNIDANLISACRVFKLSKRQILISIIIPLLSPAILNSTFLVFLASITDLASALVFEERRMLSVIIFNLVSDNPNASASVIVLALFIIITALFLPLRLYSSKFFVETVTGSYVPLQLSLGFLTKAVLGGFFASMVLLNLVPQIFVAYFSFVDFSNKFTLSHYLTLANEPQILRSLGNSLFLAFISSLAAIVISFCLALNSLKPKNSFAALEESLSNAAFILPSLFISFLLISSYRGTALDNQKAPLLLLLLVFIFKKIPNGVRTFSSVLPQLAGDLEACARVYKLPTSSIWLKIYFPLLAATFIRKFFTFFAISLFESSASLLIPFEVKYYPLSKMVYQLLNEPDFFGSSCALLTLLSVLVFLIAPLVVKLQKQAVFG